MVTAVAGMVDPVRLAEIKSTCIGAAIIILYIYDSVLLRVPKKSRGNISKTRYEVCEFVAARSGASQPAASHLL